MNAVEFNTAESAKRRQRYEIEQQIKGAFTAEMRARARASWTDAQFHLGRQQGLKQALEVLGGQQ